MSLCLAACLFSELEEMGVGCADGSWDAAGCCSDKVVVIAVELESQDPCHLLSEGGLHCLQGRSSLIKESPEIFILSQTFLRLFVDQ